jgi:shikimate kinase
METNKDRIFLVGFMGAGKSTTGPLLAKALGWEFIDLDPNIEEEMGRTIRDIFESEGEVAFRKIESQALRRLRNKSRLVVALGGGTFMSEQNRAALAALGTSVFLDCSIDVILARCPADGTRPLLRSPEQVRELYASRYPTYRLSDVCLDVSALNPDQVAQLILERLAVRPTQPVS